MKTATWQDWIERLEQWAFLIPLVPLALVTGLGPYYRGLYFTGDQLTAAIIVFLLMALALLLYNRANLPILATPVDYFALLMPVAYSVSLLVAVDIRLAIQKALLYVLYFSAFWMVSRLVTWSGQNGRRLGLYTAVGALLLGGLVVAGVGLGAMAGIIHYHDATSGGRLFSSLQYPNASAAYLACVFLLASTLAFFGRGWRRAIFGGLAQFYLLAFILTYSRGGWLVLALMVTLYVVLSSWEHWLSAALHFGLQVVVTVGAIVPLTHAFGGKQPDSGRAVVIIAAAVLVAAVLDWILAWLQAWAPEHGLFVFGLGPAASEAAAAGDAAVGAGAGASAGGAGAGATTGPETGSASEEHSTAMSKAIRWQRLVSVGIVVVLAAAGLAGLLLAARMGLLPKSIVHRAQSIDLQTYSAWSRINWTELAIRIGLKRPILGGGGGAWQALYQGYQDYGFFTKFAHDGFAQIWVETGALGLLSFLGLWISLVVSFWRYRVSPRFKQQPIFYGFYLAAFGLALHSAIDFDLALSAVDLLMWSVIGIIAAGDLMMLVQAGVLTTFRWPFRRSALGLTGALGEQEPSRAEKRAKKRRKRSKRSRKDEQSLPWRLISTSSGAAVCFALALFSAALLVGYNNGQAGAHALNTGNTTQAKPYYEKALKYDPWTASFHADYSNILLYWAQLAQDKTYVQRAQQQLETAVKLAPYDPNMHTFLGKFLLAHGNWLAGLKELDRATALEPHVITHYDTAAQGYYLVGRALVDNHKPDQALPYLKHVVQLKEQVAKVRASEPQQAPNNYRLPLDSPKLHLYVTMASMALSFENTNLKTEAQTVLKTASDQFKPALKGDKTIQAQVYMFLSVLNHDAGNENQANTLLKKAVGLDSNVKPDVSATDKLLTNLSQYKP